MPTSADPTEPSRLAVDTSVAVAFLDESHAAHRDVVEALAERRVRLAGHAAFETFSVLTRLPGALGVSTSDAATALDEAFGVPWWLPPDAQADLYGRLRTAGIVGGQVYDALVGEAARVNGAHLFTRDRRALPTYELLGVATTLL